LCNSNGTFVVNVLSSTNTHEFLKVNKVFKRLSITVDAQNVYLLLLKMVNTAPVPIVLNIYTAIQMGPRLISEKCKFWVKNTDMYCLPNLTKIHSCLAVALIFLNLCSMQPQLPQHPLVYLLSSKDLVEHTFLTIWKSMKLELKYQNIYGETFFTNYRIYFHIIFV
jgi:hypothetical protein